MNPQAKFLRTLEQHLRSDKAHAYANTVEQAADEIDTLTAKLCARDELLREWLQWFGSTNDISGRTRTALAASALETPREYTCECGHGQDQHTKGPVQSDYCRHCPCPKWTPVKRSEIGSQCSATNGGMKPTCPNCGHEPCAEWCGKETKVECDCAAEIKRHCQYDNCECRCHSENRSAEQEK